MCFNFFFSYFSANTLKMQFEDHHVKALMTVYTDLCFNKIQFEDKICLTSDLVLQADDARDFKYTLSQVLYSSDRESWLPAKQDACVQTDPVEQNG